MRFGPLALVNNISGFVLHRLQPRTADVRSMMEIVRQWNSERASATDKIFVSLELEKPGKHPLDFAELCDVLFISQVYAEDILKATNMLEAVIKARQRIENKE